MELAHRWSDRNLTRLELIVALLLLATLLGFFTNYGLRVFAQAERSMINKTVININTALNYRAAMAVMHGKYNELGSLEKLNPMEEMQSVSEINNIDLTMEHIGAALASGFVSTPGNYDGEVNTYTLEIMEQGKWYFNQDNHHLIYFVSNNEFFYSDAKRMPIIQFRVAIDYEDKNTNGQYDPETDKFKSIKLQAVGHYHWKL